MAAVTTGVLSEEEKTEESQEEVWDWEAELMALADHLTELREEIINTMTSGQPISHRDPLVRTLRQLNWGLDQFLSVLADCRRELNS